MTDFLDPKKVLIEAKIQHGSFVADLGSGVGAFAREISRRVGGTGKVFAVEVQKDVLLRMQRDFLHEGIGNVEGIWGDVEKIGGTKIKEGIIDTVLVSNVFFQVKDKITFLNEIKRILKKGGEVLLVDWLDSFSGLGPKSEEVVSPENAKNLFINSGFIVEKDKRVSSHHYAILFKLK